MFVDSTKGIVIECEVEGFIPFLDMGKEPGVFTYPIARELLFALGLDGEALGDLPPGKGDAKVVPTDPVLMAIAALTAEVQGIRLETATKNDLVDLRQGMGKKREVLSTRLYHRLSQKSVYCNKGLRIFIVEQTNWKRIRDRPVKPQNQVRLHQKSKRCWIIWTLLTNKSLSLDFLRTWYKKNVQN